MARTAESPTDTRAVALVERDPLSELVFRARAGDRGAFEDLVRETHAELFGLAMRIVGNEEDARDVLQEAFLRAYRGLGAFRGDSAVTTWLYRITANCAATHLSRRGRQRHDRLEDAEPVVDEHRSSDPEDMASVALQRDQVQAALAALPARLRVVVVLRDIYDLPHLAIADELGITETAAKVRLHRARKKLPEQLFGRLGSLEGRG
jgi:RNA polymerase sigma-70 factor (ECF subfamily)